MPLGSTCPDLTCLDLAWLTCRSLPLWFTPDFLWSACLGARCQLLWGSPPRNPSARFLPPTLYPPHAACTLHFALHLSAQQLTLHCGVAPALTLSTLPAPCTRPSAHCLRPALSTVPLHGSRPAGIAQRLTLRRRVSVSDCHRSTQRLLCCVLRGLSHVTQASSRQTHDLA